MGLVGAAVYMGVFRRLVGAAPFTLVIATLGLAIVLQTMTVLVWGPGLRTLPLLLSIRPAVHLGGVSFSSLEVFCIVVSLVLIGTIQLVLRATKLGTQMRAVADNTLLAGLTRVRVHRMSAIAWGIAAACAGVAGVCIALRTALDPIQLQGFGLVAFAAVLLGGMDSIIGALVGGLLLGLIQALAVHRFGGEWSDAAAYIVLLGVLLVRTQGLFGKPEIARL
jgi:branched-chain amino acid transport system permease protein